MKSPEISVCIPVYNTEPFIAEAIESALNQTFKDFELIILDNRSTDNTLKIVRKFKDKRIRVVAHKKNLGAEANWNAAPDQASGKYITILCADDYIYPDCLEKQVEALRAESSAVLVCAARHIVDEKGKRIMKRGPHKSETVPGIEAVRRAIRGGTNIYGETSSALFRRDAQKKAGAFDASIPYVIDLDMWTRLLLHGNLILMDEAVSAYRVGAASWSAEIMTKQKENFMRFIERIEANPAFCLTGTDAIIGRFRATLQAALRQLFYKFVLGWRKS